MGEHVDMILEEAVNQDVEHVHPMRNLHQLLYQEDVIAVVIIQNIQAVQQGKLDNVILYLHNLIVQMAEHGQLVALAREVVLHVQLYQCQHQ